MSSKSDARGCVGSTFRCVADVVDVRLSTLCRSALAVFGFARCWAARVLRLGGCAGMVGGGLFLSSRRSLARRL